MSALRTRLRPTVRLRLTLLYGTLFFAAGVLLLAVNYTLLRERLAEQVTPSQGVVSTRLLSDGATVTSTTFRDGEPGTGASGSVSEELAEYQTVLHEAAVMSVVQYQHDLRDAALNSMVVQSGIALALTGVAAIGLGWLVAGRALRPIRDITNTARRASETNLHARVNLAGPHDELKELADTFDLMLGRLETTFESQRRFAAEASHELRTPIAIIQAEADVVLAAPDVTDRERKLAEAVQAAALRGERLIASLLALARSQSTLLDRLPVDLADVTGAVVGELLPRANHKRVRLELELADAAVIGDRMLLERLAINLVENAIHHNVAHGWVDVAVSGSGATAQLRVANSGPQLDGAKLAALFEPFKRQVDQAGDSPPGVGLGLAIVQSIVLSHDGKLTATPRADGGLEVVVQLPAADLVSTSGLPAVAPAPLASDQHDHPPSLHSGSTPIPT